MYIYVYVYIHIHTYRYMNMYIIHRIPSIVHMVFWYMVQPICICVYVYTYMHISIYVYVYMYVYLYIYIYRERERARASALLNKRAINMCCHDGGVSSWSAGLFDMPCQGCSSD